MTIVNVLASVGGTWVKEAMLPRSPLTDELRVELDVDSGQGL
jgi:hypothetical protein